MDTRTLEQQLAQAQQDLLASIAAELAYGDKAREHRAEMVNPELTYQQRETQQRLYLQFFGQHTSNERITSTTHFSDELGADSLDLVELTMSVEEAFGVEIPDEDAEKFQTPADIEAWLTKHGKA